MSAMPGKTVGSLLVFLVLGFSPALRAAAPSELWSDLASADEAKATRAALQLAARPTEAIAFLREHLRPVKVETKRVTTLIGHLDSDDYATREEAARELEYLGKYVKPHLEAALAGKPSAEKHKRLQELLDRLAAEEAAAGAPAPLTGNNVAVTNAGGKITILIDGKPVNLAPRTVPTPRMAWVRAARAAAVLEYLGTPEARKLLETLATGESDAPPTKAAREALERLKDR